MWWLFLFCGDCGREVIVGILCVFFMMFLVYVDVVVVVCCCVDV